MSTPSVYEQSTDRICTCAGDNVHVHRSTKEAVAILRQRCKSLTDTRGSLENEVKASTPRMRSQCSSANSHSSMRPPCIAEATCSLRMQELERKLAIANGTLAVSLEERADPTEGILDIREDYDEAMHGPTTTPVAGAPSVLARLLEFTAFVQSVLIIIIVTRFSCQEAKCVLHTICL